MIATAPRSAALTARAAPHASTLGTTTPVPISRRFTPDGSDELERHLQATCDKIAAGIAGIVPANRIDGIVLGGGYGRGEGGVWRTDAGDRPYNDLEFYVFLRGNRHLNEWRYGRALHVLGEILTPQAGLDVEFKIASMAELVRSPVSMFSYDLVCGHRVVFGDHVLLNHCHAHRRAENIPLHEATRLMMNRGAGLLFARERLIRDRFTAGDADFVARNIAKARLGAGDAVLTAHGQYHWSVRERQRRLARLARDMGGWFHDLAREHAVGVDFKLHPTRSAESRETLVTAHAEMTEFCRTVWLWLESRRLQHRFDSIEAYVHDAASKCPEAATARNALVNARVFGSRAISAGRLFRHPRERVLDALALLLWEPGALTNPAHRHRLQAELTTRSTDFAGLVGAFRGIWSRVN